jgi:TRAP-type C4-dicarboxylate transport system permease small subunit
VTERDLRRGWAGQAGPWSDRVLILLGIMATVVMLASTLAAVVARHFELGGFEWSYEVAGLTFLWVTFLGAIAAEVRGQNAAFEVIRQGFAPRVRSFLEIATSLVLGLVGLAIAVSGAAFLQRSAWVPTPLLRWPGMVGSAAPLVLGAGLCVVALARIGRSRRPQGGMDARRSP